MKFHPDVPIDTKFFYTVMVEENAFMDRPEPTKLGVFFNPEDAYKLPPPSAYAHGSGFTDKPSRLVSNRL